jgi:hypothetical protein
VLAAGQDYATDRDHVHVANGLADDGESVVPDLTVGDEVVGPDERSMLDLGTNSSMSIVRVDSSAMFSNSSFDTSM